MEADYSAWVTVRTLTGATADATLYGFGHTTVMQHRAND